MTPPPSPPGSPRPTLPGRAAQYARVVVALMLLSWVVSFLPFPLRFGLLVVSAGAVAAAVVALVEAFRTAGLTRLRVMLTFGLAVSGYFSLVGLGYLLIAPDVMAYEDCMSKALTVQRENHCRVDYRQDVFDRWGVKIP